jgi:hypothetical protein
MDRQETEAWNDCAGEGQQQFNREADNLVNQVLKATRVVDSKYVHESRGTRNQESLCWRGPTAV